MHETWRQIPGFEGYYQVSDHGNVRSLRCGMGVRSRPRPVKARPTKDGYLRVALHSAERPKAAHTNVSRLVLMAFVGPRPDGHDAAHQDGVRTNNRLSNLRWMTHQANIDQRDEHGTTAWGEADGNAKLTAEQVQDIRSRVAGGERQRDIARFYGVCKGTISHIITGRNWARLAA
jgi:hypothetical protein